MLKFLLYTYSYFNRRKLQLYILVLLLFASFAFLASRIGLNEDISRMMPGSQAAATTNELLSSTALYDKIVVKVKTNTENPELLIAAADSLATLASLPQVKELKIRVDENAMLDVYDVVINNLPLLLNEQDYRKIDSLIAPQQLTKTLAKNYKALTTAEGFIAKKVIADDPTGMSLLALKKLQSLQLNEKFELYDGYMMSDELNSLFLFITPANPGNETSENGKLIDALDNKIAHLKTSLPEVEVFYFGGTAVAVSNARQLKHDTQLTLSITVVSLLLFVWLFFRKKRIPLLMMLPVLFGGLLALAFIFVVKGKISTIAVASGSIVLGIALNYSLHFFSHYKHCKNIQQTLSELYLPLTLGGLTTIASFFALMLLESSLLNDFGLFAGLSLCGAAIFTLIFLPHFMPDFTHNEANAIEDSITRIPPLSTKKAAGLTVIILALTIFFLKHAGKVSFETDMSSMNFMNTRLKASEREIMWLQNDTSKTVFIAATGNTKQQLLQQNETLIKAFEMAQQQGFVKQFSSISTVIASHTEQQKKLQRWKNYWTEEKKITLLNNLKSYGKQQGFSNTAFNRFSDLLNSDFSLMSTEDESFLTQTLGSDFFIHAKKFDALINSVTVDKANRKLFYTQLQTMPDVVILDKQIITSSFIDAVYKDFNTLLTYTVFIVSIALLIGYGRIELALITFLPMLISWIWILGIMGLAGIHFNIINIIIATFIFGLGDDFSIFITDGLTQKFKENKPIFASHKVSIFLCAIATLLGLGALIFAKHPALKSIAAISIIGILCVVFIGQTIQPLLYNYFIHSRKEKGFAPWTLPSLTLAVFAFSYFVVGALVLTLSGFLLLYVFPFPKKKHRKLAYHFLLSKFVGSLVYIMVNVRKVHIDKHNMDFSKPAIIIANHMSFLDILVVAMQHPKMILLTNKWVYHSPVFGKVVQLAEYYPVMEGVDPATEKLESIIEQGYSIAVFPEGTRTTDGVMKRFHKGAFFLAEKLNIDIVPLVLHGTGDTMGKGDFMLFNGTMTMKFLPRIAQNDPRFGDGYAARTKAISKYFKQEYEALKNELETPQYFKQRLMANYNYKGWNVEWAARKAARQTDFFVMLNDLTKHCRNITELGCGYGFNAYMLHFLNKQKSFLAIDINQEKTDTAANCYSKNAQLNFVCADVFEYDFLSSNAFIVHDFFFIASIEKQHNLLSILATQLSEDGVLCFVVKVADAVKHYAVIKNHAAQFNFKTQQHFCGSKSKYALLTLQK